MLDKEFEYINTFILGGMPSTGAIARTATNIQSGAIYTYIWNSAFYSSLLCVLILSPLARYVPLSAMAPIHMVAYNMSERHHVWKILKIKSAESIVLILTLLLTVFVDLTVAVEVRNCLNYTYIYKTNVNTNKSN